MAIEIDENFMVVRCSVTGNESGPFSRHQWGALMVLASIDDRIVTFDDIAEAIYTEQELAYNGVSDEAISGTIRRLRRRIRDVSELDHILTYRGWGWRLSLEGRERADCRRLESV